MKESYYLFNPPRRFYILTLGSILVAKSGLNNTNLAGNIPAGFVSVKSYRNRSSIITSLSTNCIL